MANAHSNPNKWIKVPCLSVSMFVWDVREYIRLIRAPQQPELCPAKMTALVFLLASYQNAAHHGRLILQIAEDAPICRLLRASLLRRTDSVRPFQCTSYLWPAHSQQSGAAGEGGGGCIVCCQFWLVHLMTFIATLLAILCGIRTGRAGCAYFVKVLY